MTDQTHAEREAFRMSPEQISSCQKHMELIINSAAISTGQDDEHATATAHRAAYTLIHWLPALVSESVQAALAQPPRAADAPGVREGKLTDALRDHDAALVKPLVDLVREVACLDCLLHARPKQCDPDSWGACIACKARGVLALLFPTPISCYTAQTGQTAKGEADGS